MKKNVIAIVAAVALVLLAVPTIAFANGCLLYTSRCV